MDWSIVLQRVLAQSLLYAVLLVGFVVFMWPMGWLVLGSLKSAEEIYSFPPSLLPSQIVWSTYPDAMKDFKFLQGLRNTMTVVIGVMAGTLLSCSLAAFAFARLRLVPVRLREGLFVIVLATMMLPYHVTLIPQFLVYRDLGWLNTFKPLIVPSFFATNAYIIFLMRQFFMSLPAEYDDAARIDGCGYFGIYWHIIVPQSLPLFGVVAILSFTGTWNDFFGPLIYLNDLEKMTLAVALQVWDAGRNQPGAFVTPVTHILALSTIVAAFPVILFFIAQRYFIQGIVISGVKG
jgi:ABC-type glycerol-3-phosphate transport system permease component